MTKIQTTRDLRLEMMAVARGERKPPAGANLKSYNSVTALVRLLTDENRDLLAMIRDRRPESISELGKLSGRSRGNVTRSLSKLETAGFVEFVQSGRTKKPVAVAKSVTLSIDPYSIHHDRVEVA